MPAGSASPGCWNGIAWLLERMFNAFVKHGVFHPSGARILKWLGGLFIVSGIIQVIAAIYVVIEHELHPSLYGGFFGTLSTLVLGAFILMFGWVLEEACELSEQQELTV